MPIRSDKWQDKTGWKSQDFITRQYLVERVKTSLPVKTGKKSQVLMTRWAWMEDQCMCDKSWLEERVRSSWQDRTRWKSQDFMTCHFWMEESGLHDKTILDGKSRLHYKSRLDGRILSPWQDWREKSISPPPNINPPCFPTGYDLNDLDQVRLGCTKAQYWKTWYQFNPPYFPKLKWIHFSLQSPPPLRQHTLLFLFCDDRVICKWILIEPGTVL